MFHSPRFEYYYFNCSKISFLLKTSEKIPDRKRAEQTDGKHNHARKVRHRKIKGSLASLTPWKGGGKGKLMSEEESGPDGPVITEKDMEEEEERYISFFLSFFLSSLFIYFPNLLSPQTICAPPRDYRDKVNSNRRTFSFLKLTHFPPFL